MALSPFVLERLHREMNSSPSGRLLLENKPLITEESLGFNTLNSLPSETLGRQYYSFMVQHGFSANHRSHVRFMDNYELAYVMIRYRQIHGEVYMLELSLLMT